MAYTATFRYIRSYYQPLGGRRWSIFQNQRKSTTMASRTTLPITSKLGTCGKQPSHLLFRTQGPHTALYSSMDVDPMRSPSAPGPTKIHQRGSPMSISSRPFIPKATTSDQELPIDALIFDCDGVIVESEDIHRRAYNATFEHFDVRCPDAPEAPVEWTETFYDELQNKVGGGKPKMRWYFGQHGWPTSTILDGKSPMTEEDQIKLIDTLQDWKTEKYKDIIGSGEVVARPGILALMDAARAANIPVAVCSAATKAAVIFVLENLLGNERFGSLDLFMAGDDVPVKKPDPTIYRIAAERLQVDPARCLVIEDSIIGLEAALGAEMQCVITVTSSTASQDFAGALAVLESMDDVDFSDLVSGKVHGVDFRKVESLS